MLKRYSFFAIVNVKTGEFEVFATAMRDYRLRYSAMKSSFKRWAEQPKESIEFPYRSYYRFFKSEYEYAYLLDKGMYTEETAANHVETLTQRMRDKSTQSV
tara:strand:- start:246 stop:548 length:303 start_codon:yes stop_codon:yes gene_type:complete